MTCFYKLLGNFAYIIVIHNLFLILQATSLPSRLREIFQRELFYTSHPGKTAYWQAKLPCEKSRYFGNAGVDGIEKVIEKEIDQKN